MGSVGRLHDRLVTGRRIEVLASWFAKLAPEGIRILDVGCGDGLLSATLQSKRPDLTIRGIDVLPRAQSFIAVDLFDGVRIPFEDSSFDAVLFSDVLHHTDDPAVLLREARRVASKWLLIKDHYKNGLAAGLRLRFMDWVGNARFGVALPYNYWSEEQWGRAWREMGFEPENVIVNLGLYPAPANWIFGTGLHFMARIRKGS
jgi:SAM-dependent methyltransferase